MLKKGDKAPSFNLKGSDGKIHKLSDYKGKKVVLYIYPKDGTLGCTAEACSFRDHYNALIKKKAVLIGISGDSIDSHRKFKEKNNLPFLLLSDPNKKVIEKYGALKPHSIFGRTFLAVIRSTFIIDKNGKIAKVFPKVKVLGHSKDVLEAL